MTFELCRKVRELEPYQPIAGEYRIRLDANESFYDLPDYVKNEIKDIIENTKFNRYPDSTAKELTSAFADYYGISSEYITVTNGSDEVLYLLASAMLTKGSRVVVTDPDFSMYGFYSFLSENEIFTFRKNDDLNIDTEKLISFANEKNADMIIFSNPCNPSSQGITADEVRKLVRGMSGRLVIVDEAYMDFWNESVLKEAHEYDNLIVLRTASKAVGAAGIRLGFAVANPVITKALRAVKSPYNVNTLSQKIGTCIYNHKDMLKNCRDTIISNTKALYLEIKKLIDNYQLPMRVFEPCTNFIFIETDKAERIYEYMLKNGIAVRYFKGNSALRVTTGTNDENNEFERYFEKFIVENILKTNR